jgi:heptaprenylglyceryl phosphate synthase
MTIRKFGLVYLEAVSWQLKTNAERAAADAYRQSIAVAVGGEVRDSSSSKNVYVGSGCMTVEHLQCHDDAVFDAIERLIQQFRELEGQ